MRALMTRFTERASSREFSGLRPAIVACLFAAAQWTPFLSLWGADPIRSDERVIFFPVAASQDPQSGDWTAEIHGWIYEPESTDAARAAVLDSLQRLANPGGDWSETAARRSRERMRPFLVDNERSKQIDIRIADRTVSLAPSAIDGHFFGSVTLSPREVETHSVRNLVSFHVENSGRQRFGGTVRCVPRRGLSVVSDVDDTIKVSEVLDRRRLLARTFVEEFEAVAGMPELYQRLEKEGAVFYYVSASPWQLYRPLEEFCRAEKFPEGTWTLKRVRLKDASLLGLLSAPNDYKIPVINALVKQDPDRKFLLVGDDGERDPEVYGEIARRHPKQVERIWIRKVRTEDRTAERFRRAFRDLPDELWIHFDTPAGLVSPVRPDEAAN